jgi:dynein heavy chain
MTNPGIDSQDEIIGIVSLMEIDKYLISYSLGHGRGYGEKELIQEGSEKGFWVRLQNFHLSLL